MTAALIDRRMLLAGGLMVPAAAIAARLAPPDTEVNAAAIRWPLGAGREAHGYMAIAARARGRQPAILIVGGRDTPDSVTRGLVRSAGQAGFVACTLNAASIINDRLADDMTATAGWLANGRYGTGRIGVVGIGGGVAAAVALAAMQTVTAAVIFGGDTATRRAPTLAFRHVGDGWSVLTDPPGSPTLPLDWAAAWDRAMVFLRGRLT